MVGAAGLEPATLCLEGRCSIHLSYAPTEKIYHMAKRFADGPAAPLRSRQLRKQGQIRLHDTPECLAVRSALYCRQAHDAMARSAHFR
jgi:hypothetical protein